MITEMPIMQTPEWLDGVANGNEAVDFPLQDILTDSLYYPASGLNGTPIKFLAGNIYSFVYADYLVSKREFLSNLNGSGSECGFKGYSSILQKEIFQSDIVPSDWRPLMVPTDPGDIERLLRQEHSCQPFGHWSVWRRNPETETSEGPEKFSFLFLAGEMSAIYQGLYNRLGIAPMVLAIIQPGAIGGEWEGVTSDDSFFKKVVNANPAGFPEYLLYGGFGGGGSYKAPCWSEYGGEKILQLPERCAGLWKRKN